MKQTPRQWNAKLTEVLQKNQLQQSKLDQSLFLKRNSGEVTMVLVYVDYMLITWDNLKLIVETKIILQQTFKMKDLGDLKYALKLISEVGLSAAKPTVTPLDTNIKLTTKEYDGHCSKSEDLSEVSRKVTLLNYDSA